MEGAGTWIWRRRQPQTVNQEGIGNPSILRPCPLELAYKPDSVFVRRFIYATNPEGRRAASAPPYLALLQAGFARPASCLDRR